MTDRKLTMEFVADRIRKTFPADVNVIYTDDNAEKLVMHIRLSTQEQVGAEDVSRAAAV
jgi:DNA-directed RNA polymerase II subunit RPB1